MGETHGTRVVVLKPMEYMNASGQPVARARTFYQVEPASIVVVHDDLDLDFGRLKVKQGGGHAGHNGLRSIIADLGTPDFVRVRLGIGRPIGEGADYVLSDFAKAERKEVPFLVGAGADAVEAVVAEGAVGAMNRFNVRQDQEEEGS